MAFTDVYAERQFQLSSLMASPTSGLGTRAPVSIAARSNVSSSRSPTGGPQLDRVPEESPSSSSAPLIVGSDTTQDYGATHDGLRRDLEEGDDEDEEEGWEIEMEAYGLYEGSYKRLLALYTLVPLSAILALVLAALLLFLLRHRHQFPEPSPYPYSFPSPLPQILLSAALFSLSHASRIPIFYLSSSLVYFLPYAPSSPPQSPAASHTTFIRHVVPSAPTLTTFISICLHTLLALLLRISALPTLTVRHRMTYTYPTWKDVETWITISALALGWAAADAVTGVVQGYATLALYKDSMVPRGRAKEFFREWKANQGAPQQGREYFRFADQEESGPVPSSEAGSDKDEVERDLDTLIRLREREDVEEVYGVPFVRVPIFVSCLMRVNSVLLSVGLMFLLSAAYLRSDISLPSTHATQESSRDPLAYTIPVVWFLHVLLSLLHSTPLLPQLGAHVAAYVGVLTGLASVFAGLAVWGVLS